MDFSRFAPKNSIDTTDLRERLGAALPDIPFPALETMLADFASAFTQNNRLLNLQIGDGQTYNNRLLPQSAEGNEALSESYRYELICLSPDAFIPLDGLLGLDVQIDILSAGRGLFEPESEQITRCGLITEAEALPSDGGFAKYKLIIESPLALLRHRRTSRVFQEKNVPDIVKAILDEHMAANPAIGRTLQVKFSLSNLIRQYPERSYCLQYRETDLDFIERLLFEEGICYHWEHETGDVATCRFVAFDDPWGLEQADQGSVRFHRASATESEDSLTEWTQARRIGPSSAVLTSYEYKGVRTTETGEESRAHVDQWGERGEGIQAEAGLEDFDAQTLYYGSGFYEEQQRYTELRQAVHDRKKGGYSAQGNMRGLLAGQWFELKNHPAFKKLSKEECEFVACKLKFTANNNLPKNLSKYLTSPVPKAAEGELPKPYWVEISARKRGLPLYPAYAHTRHAKPTARGIQTATVTGPEKEEVFTDEMGRVKIQFHWQRPKEHPEFGADFDENSSCWVRVGYPSAGHAWGSQYIPRIGQEVIVDFIEGDIDRPIITGAVHNGRQLNPRFSEAWGLPGNRTLSGIKSKEHHGQQYGELLFDDTTEQVRTKLSSEHGKTQLNQGFLTHPRSDGQADPRGEGFELRSDRSGAIRAAEGVLLSAYAQRNADGRQLDRDETIALLELALSVAKDLSKTSTTHNAESTDTVEQERLLRDVKQWEDGSNTAKDNPVKSNKAILAVTAPDGVALATDANVTIAANSNVDQIAAQDINQTAGRNFRVRVGEALSLFVQRMGMKLIAAAGKIQVQAQSDEIEIGAAKKMYLYSLEEILMEAPKVTIRGQNGEVVYENGIVSRTTASNVQHAGNHALEGPASATASLPGMPASTTETDEKFIMVTQSGDPVSDVLHEIKNEQGGIESAGGTDGTGSTSMKSDKIIKRLKMFLK